MTGSSSEAERTSSGADFAVVAVANLVQGCISPAVAVADADDDAVAAVAVLLLSLLL